ncbi:hypothetical protein P152DRAFT_396949 [Eremomyces bilateralis CBS 781.70]|uniref:WD40 repeat-like protein n=1 Tax=Eremomyces bilateralis CBS 781.70 TaxID=1392243 RepID=A0A6G1G471_9PEZI|nr:uncharacterized protein P152DRAFT_396949 [Eremomyces bilateralis CBS 781.70]KAF1812706.1 hypothetical protein P152DRAFT_396949 [Eremomyces bilateralis CBS 781.70]
MENISEKPSREHTSAFDSKTFELDVQIKVHETVGSASISPSGRDVVLASREGLHIIDLDNLYSTPRHLVHRSPWEVADVQWSPFSSRDYWIVSTSNQKALVWNLDMLTRQAPIEHTLHAHSRAITDINFSALHPDLLATCAVDSYVHCWDLRRPAKPVLTFAEWNAGATQVKWNRQDAHIIASSHDKYLHIWDDRKGTIPLRTIEAHATKIYGIDWNRTRASDIVTCSLDHTIKFWDYENDASEPERVIHTPYPVWRARHTPFGYGLLAMPQRGNFDLHLFDRRLGDGESRESVGSPTTSFKGHNDQAKEFLWRSRGTVEDGIDNRDFQLISWGMDRQLLLHRITDEHLKPVGHQKGENLERGLKFTRQGAEYRTFRDEPTHAHATNLQDEENKPKGLGALLAAAGMSRAPLPVHRSEGVHMTPSVGMQARRTPNRTINPIAWMAGVRVGRAGPLPVMVRGFTPRSSRINQNDHQIVWDTPESLSDEITYVGKKYKKVTFELANIGKRSATVTLNGPWAADEKPAFLRVNLSFPDNYPADACPQYDFEKTVSAISEDTMERLKRELRSITEHYQTKKRGSLEAIITYLLGERGLEDSISFSNADDVAGLAADESSSSDEEEGVGPAFHHPDGQDLELSGAEIGPSTANVPVPKTCGALWTPDGRLVCFFPPKPEPKPLFSLSTLRAANHLQRGNRVFEGFGRLNTESPDLRENSSVVDDETSDSGGSSESSSTTSSDSERDIGRLPSRFMRSAAWKGAMLRFHKTSQQSSAEQGSKGGAGKSKAIISIHDLHSLLPAKKALAGEYLMFGNGPLVCDHNSRVAAVYGDDDTAAVWNLAKLMLYNEIPLEIMDQQQRKEPIVVLARRSWVRVKKKDSGIDLQLDKPATVENPALRGRVKWGNHPIASVWLIPQLFEHYEKLADIQMLAMLSCIFFEPAAKEGVHTTLIRQHKKEFPMSMKSAAFGLDYFATQEVAWSLFQPNVLVSSGLRSSFAKPWDNGDAKLGVYGSAESSNGPWGTDNFHSEPPTPFSTGDTPPVLSRSNTFRSSAAGSFSTSPEHHLATQTRRVNSNISNAFQSLRTLAMNVSSSPPTQGRHRNDGDLSTSAPTSGITWGENKVYDSPRAHAPRSTRVSTSGKRDPYGFLLDDGFVDSYSVEGAVLGPERNSSSLGSDERFSTSTAPTNITESITIPRGGSSSIRVTMKNQNRFDNEAHGSVPLLDPGSDERYKAYRMMYAHLLGSWELWVERAELLQFNGLTSYWEGGKSAWAIDPDGVHERSEKGPKVGSDICHFHHSGRSDFAQGSFDARSHHPSGASTPHVDKEKPEFQKFAIVERAGETVFEHASPPRPLALLVVQCEICVQSIVGLFYQCAACGRGMHWTCLELFDGRYNCFCGREVPHFSTWRTTGGEAA